MDLLVPLPDNVVEEHHRKVMGELGAAAAVQAAGPGRGRGLFSTQAFKPGDVIFTERAIVSQQDNDSAHELLACDHCHCFVGSVEAQVARLLRRVVQRAHRLTGALASDGSSSGVGSGQGSSAANGDEGALSAGGQEEEEDAEEVLQRMQLFEAFVGEDQLARLEAGEITLPLSGQVPLPAPVMCEFGCGATYCTAGCRERAWREQHCLLCPGSGAPDSKSGSGGGGSGTAGREPPAAVMGMRVERCRLWDFYAHARATNDVFRLAARLLAGVALHAAAQLGEGPGRGGGRSDAPPPLHAVTQPDGPQGPPTPEAAQALMAAWLPYGAAWKARWWDAVAVPAHDQVDPQAFKDMLRSLAADSLGELVAALPGAAAAWPALFALDTWGAVIGMFELNNLGLAVPSPVEDYFLMVDGLDEPQRSTVQAESQRWLDALDTWYDTPLRCNGFFAAQSCMNHSCAPNAATEGKADGRVDVYALRDVAPGEELTISYLDEPPDAPLSRQQRQEALRDYGFVCQCARCVEELRLAKERVRGARRAGGVKLGRK